MQDFFYSGRYIHTADLGFKKKLKGLKLKPKSPLQLNKSYDSRFETMVVSQAARRVRRTHAVGYEPSWWSAVRTTVQRRLEAATGIDLDGDGHQSAQAKVSKSSAVEEKAGLDLDGDGFIGDPNRSKTIMGNNSRADRPNERKLAPFFDAPPVDPSADADSCLEVNEVNIDMKSEDVSSWISLQRRRGSAGSRDSHLSSGSASRRHREQAEFDSAVVRLHEEMKEDNSKGTITIRQLRAAMKRENPNVTETQVKRRWREMDINGDGDVSLTELAQAADGGSLKPTLNGGVFGQGASIQAATDLKILQEVADDEVVEKSGVLKKRVVGAEIRWDDRYVTLTGKRMHIRNSKDGPIREEIDLLDITHVKTKLNDEKAESGRELTRAATRAQSLHKEHAEDNATRPSDWVPGNKNASSLSLAQTQWKHSFEVYAECFGRTYYWRAAGETECEEWVEALNKAMKDAQESSLNVSEKIRQDVYMHVGITSDISYTYAKDIRHKCVCVCVCKSRQNVHV